ncbi:MAG: RNA polymerase sigma factor [Pseudomonadota bacterium]
MDGKKEQEKSVLVAFADEQARLLGYLSKEVRSRDTAEELVQEAWIKVARNAKEASAAPKPYIWRIAKTLIIDHFRSEKRCLNQYEISEIFDTATQITAEDIVSARDDLRALERAIAELPKRRKEIFSASRLVGEKHQSIAKRFGVTVRTVEMEVKKALEHCNHRLGRSDDR